MDAETMEAIEKWAADEFRSTNGQLQWIIAEALRKSGRMKKKKTIIKRKKKNDTVVLIVYTVRVYKKGVNIDKTNYFSYFHRVF